MDLSKADLSTLVCRRVLRDDLGSVSMTKPMLNVLIQLDGEEDLAAVAARLGLSPGAIRETVARLQQMGLVEVVSRTPPCLDPEFLSFIRTQLRLAIGPIADVIIEDALLDLGHEADQFPAHRAAELIDLLSREIQKDDKRLSFQKSMLQGIARVS